jgi:hypothetical protein
MVSGFARPTALTAGLPVTPHVAFTVAEYM